jgi:hypothetical protein
MLSTHARITVTTLAAAALVLGVPPRAPAEPRPQEYDVRIRYRIDAYRNQHLVQFAPMLRYFESLGFQKDEGSEDEAENPAVTLMTGTIPAANALKLLNERHVEAILLLPKGTKLPGAEEPVRVDLGLASFLKPEQVRLLAGKDPARPDDLAAAEALLAQQRALADQARGVLVKDLGFREGAGYDSRWHTRLVGMVPAGKLDALLDDLRKQPAGAKIPAPFRTAWPLRVIEVMSQVPFPVQRPVPIPPPRGQEKIAPELRAILADEAAAAQPLRMEMILSATPPPEDRTWRDRLEEAVVGLVIEGRLGPVVSVLAPANQAPALAALADVSTVRLPRSGEPRVLPLPASKGDGPAAVRQAGLDLLHGLNHRGRGVRVVIIDGDFRGWQALVGKQLPKKTSYMDLTAERNLGLLPDEPPGDPNVQGAGTQCAVAAAVAAPDAEFTLVRIDPAAPYQLEEVARSINGERFLSLNLSRRNDDLEADRRSIDRRQEELNKERQALLNENVSLDPNLGKKPEAYGLDPKRDKELIDRQQAYIQAKARLDSDYRDYEDRVSRFLRLVDDLHALTGTHVVASALSWNEGYPVDGTSALSRYFDDRPFHGALWFQAAGNTHGQSWSGPFRDPDGDGRMKFAPLGTPLPEGRWSPELNFLAWEPAGKPQTGALPAGTRFRLSVQWREAHDPEFFRDPADPYRPSLARLNLVLLRQPDPSGAKQPRDDLEVVAQSAGLPQRIDNQPTFATYEQTVEFTVKEPGHYVVRVEGRQPVGIRPPGVPTLPALQTFSEIRPRVFVQTLEGPGRAVFADYAPPAGSLGMPADARAVITVGAADLENRAQPYSAAGPPHDLELLRKPDVLAYDTLGRGGAEEAYGTSLATGFATGVAASAISAGVPRSTFLETMQVMPGGVLRVPRARPVQLGAPHGHRSIPGQ